MCFLFCYKNVPQQAQTPITQASSRTGLPTALPLPQPPSLCSSSNWLHQKGVLISLTKASAWPPLSVNPWGQLSPCHQFLRQHCTLLCFSKCLGTLKPLWKAHVPLSPPASPPWWAGLPGAPLTPTLPTWGGFSDTQQLFCDRFLQPCCHFSLQFVISSSTWTSWEGASPAAAPEHHRQLCHHSVPWSACPVAGLEILRATGK